MFCLIGLSILAGCMFEEETIENVEEGLVHKVFTAVVEDGDITTKTILDETEVAGVRGVLWEPEDAIGVAKYGQKYQKFINTLDIVYSGTPAVRAGGGYKKFTLKELINNDWIDATDVQWSIDFSDGDLDKLDTIKKDNVLKVKCLPFYDLVGKSFTIIAESKHSSQSLIVEVISL